MARRVVSIMSGAPAAISPFDPVLEANVYAVAADVDLTVLLRGAAIEYATRLTPVPAARLAGRAMPDARCARDLRGLLESGVAVFVDADAVRRAGLRADDLVDGVRWADNDRRCELLRTADAVLHW